MNRIRAIWSQFRRISKTEVKDMNPFNNAKACQPEWSTSRCSTCTERYKTQHMLRIYPATPLHQWTYLCANCVIDQVGGANMEVMMFTRMLCHYYEAKIRRLERKIETRTGTLQNTVKCIKSCRAVYPVEEYEKFHDKD